ETLLAAKDLGADRESEALKKALVGETADLWFHTLVMLSHLGLSHDEVLEELRKRFTLSGLAERPPEHLNLGSIAVILLASPLAWLF
ncbi:MAG: hypothetical protein MUQ61_06250, partial [OM182 bacterium]|nr:hypothetical protein [OM182 bacterium]